MLTSCYYYDQDPSGFCFLAQLRALVIETSLRATKFKYEMKH